MLNCLTFRSSYKPRLNRQTNGRGIYSDVERIWTGRLTDVVFTVRADIIKYLASSQQPRRRSLCTRAARLMHAPRIHYMSALTTPHVRQHDPDHRRRRSRSNNAAERHLRTRLTIRNLPHRPCLSSTSYPLHQFVFRCSIKYAHSGVNTSTTLDDIPVSSRRWSEQADR